MMYNIKIKKKNFFWPYGEFSDIKSSNRNPMDDFEIFFLLQYYFLSENAATSGGRLAQFQY